MQVLIDHLDLMDGTFPSSPSYYETTYPDYIQDHPQQCDEYSFWGGRYEADALSHPTSQVSSHTPLYDYYIDEPAHLCGLCGGPYHDLLYCPLLIPLDIFVNAINAMASQCLELLHKCVETISGTVTDLSELHMSDHRALEDDQTDHEDHHVIHIETESGEDVGHPVFTDTSDVPTPHTLPTPAPSISLMYTVDYPIDSIDLLDVDVSLPVSHCYIDMYLLEDIDVAGRRKDEIPVVHKDSRDKPSDNKRAMRVFDSLPSFRRWKIEEEKPRKGRAIPFTLFPFDPGGGSVSLVAPRRHKLKLHWKFSGSQTRPP
jgi:hypothetical protein